VGEASKVVESKIVVHGYRPPPEDVRSCREAWDAPHLTDEHACDTSMIGSCDRGCIMGVDSGLTAAG
jgi:hypothetical protein